MTKEEYLKGIEKIELKAKIEKIELSKTYALTNNPYKVGDLVTDHAKTIRIEVIKCYLGRIPECTYYGIKINKDGKDNKKGDKETIYQSNIKVN